MTAEQANSASTVRKRRGKVLYQLLALCLVIGIGPLVVSSWRLMKINQRTIETGIFINQTLMVETKAENVRTFLERVREALLGLSGLQGTVNLLDVGSRQNILIQFIDSYGYIERLKVLDQKGGEVSDVSRSSDVNLWQVFGEKGMKKAFQKAVSGSIHNGPAFLHVGDSGAHTYMSVAVPLRNEEARIQGVLMAIVNLDNIQTLISKDLVSKNVQAYLMDKRGGIIAHSELSAAGGGERPPESQDRSSLSDPEIVDYLKAGQTTGSVPFRDRQGREMLGAYKVIDDVNWGLVIKQPRDEAYISLDEMKSETVKLVVVAVLLATGIGAAFAQRISRPIRLFADKSMAIANGDFKGRIDMKTGNEIGQLAETFNYMTERLDIYDKNMRDLFISTIKSLSAAIDAKDPYTQGHSERVTRFSLAIAREMNLDDEVQEQVQIAALLHDVGKIGIEDKVLRKPDRLTDEEFGLIKQHPDMGANIMAPIKQLKNITPGMRHHHEAFDGSGYPDGLKGVDIPQIARVIAVADTFDAMTSDRLYQKAMEDQFVIETLIKLSGKRYDPKMVQAFITAHQKKRIISYSSLKKATAVT